MEFRVLGSLEVEEEGRVLKLGGAKQRALLALLLLYANEAVSRERLIDELWGSTPPETAPAAIQVYVSQLRKLLGREVIVTQPPGYLIRVREGTLDLERFESWGKLQRELERLERKQDGRARSEARKERARTERSRRKVSY